MSDLSNAMKTAVSGMKAQGIRMRVITENLANSGSTGTQPGEEPYRRKEISFKAKLDRQSGAEKVEVSKISRDDSEFDKMYDPAHPAADAEGYVQMPNVNPLVEMMDMKEAQRSYQANINAMTSARDMLSNTLQILESN